MEPARRIDLAVFPCEWGRSWKPRFQIFLILLLAVLAGTALLARRINIAPAILLLLAGIALAFSCRACGHRMPPELVLLMVLPPLICSAGVRCVAGASSNPTSTPIILLISCVVDAPAFAVATATRY